MGDSGDFVFARDADGQLQYKGDFEGLYRAMDDPWGQSGRHPRMREYYQYSRRQLLSVLCGLRWKRLLEAGCGGGHVTNQIALACPRNKVVHGCDISPAAVERARSLFPRETFFCLDITDPAAVEAHRRQHGPYGAVLLNQILWYILPHLSAVIANADRLLVPGGNLIVQTAFLDHQEYGRAIIDGWPGLLRWVLDHAPAWQIIRLATSYDDSSRCAPYHDGLLVLRAPYAPEPAPAKL